jgi:hypothetical protein
VSAARAAAADSGGGALSLRSWFAEAEAASSIARQVADTPFVPDSLKRWAVAPTKEAPGRIDLDATVAVVTAALLAGQELGFSPMASLRSMDIIKGTPALRAIALRALVQKHGHDIVVVESTMTRAVVRGCRQGGDVQESVWTLDRAKLLGLYPGTEYGQWRKQPQSQLVARATAEAARWIAADAILGLPYIAEELRDAPDELPPADLADEQDAAAPHPAATRNARKRTLRALAAPVTPPTPPPNPAPPTPTITNEQIKLLNGALRAHGLTRRADAAAAVSRWVGREVKGSTDLSFDEAERALAAISDEAAAARAEQDAEPGPDDPPPDDDGQVPGGD